MRIIGRKKGYWKRIWKAQDKRRKLLAKYNGNALTSSTSIRARSSVPTADPSAANSKNVAVRDMVETPKVVSV